MKPFAIIIRRAPALLVLSVVWAISACQATWPDTAPLAGRAAVVTPDYADTVVAPNIAPLNFLIKEPGVRFLARVEGDQGGSIDVATRDGRVVWPTQAWKDVMARNVGAGLRVTVAVQAQDGTWRRFSSLRIQVAREPLDRYLVYRLIPPLDHYWVNVGIYQRDVEGNSERPVVENQNFSVGHDGCVNCHSFRRNKPDRMTLHIRSPSLGRLMVVVKDGVLQKVDTAASGISRSPAAYEDWHPDGRHIAFSMNKVRPVEHTVGEHRDVWDDDSDVAVYDTDTNRVSTTHDIADPERRETWPSWSADGRTLYFSSAPQLPLTDLEAVKYDLMRIAYDPSTGAWGKRETILSAADSGMSATQPKESPDGRWLLFVLSHHGNFPVFQPSSRLHVIDLRTGARRPLTAVNDGQNSWHSWSSNGRWIVFASKRDGNVLGRIYFSYFDRNGEAHKPFVLPQPDPATYESSTLTYNLPELVTSPVPLNASQLGRAIATKPTLPAPSLSRQ